MPGCLTWEEAASFVEGFNEAALSEEFPDGEHAGAEFSRRGRLWAVAVLVVPRFEGDLRGGKGWNPWPRYLKPAIAWRCINTRWREPPPTVAGASDVAAA